jgi:hypothetical protein
MRSSRNVECVPLPADKAAARAAQRLCHNNRYEGQARPCAGPRPKFVDEDRSVQCANASPQLGYTMPGQRGVGMSAALAYSCRCAERSPTADSRQSVNTPPNWVGTKDKLH